MMISLPEYRIQHKGLKNGVHQYSFDIEDSFFALFEASQVKNGKVKLDLTLDKKDNMIELSFDLKGTFAGTCDRCTAAIDVPFDGMDQVIIKFVAEPEGDTDEVIFRDVKDTHLDITELVYEIIHVHLPINALRDCDAEDYIHCDHDVLDVLDRVDEDDKADDDDQPENPLWQGLKDIKID